MDNSVQSCCQALFVWKGMKCFYAVAVELEGEERWNVRNCALSEDIDILIASFISVTITREVFSLVSRSGEMYVGPRLAPTNPAEGCAAIYMRIADAEEEIPPPSRHFALDSRRPKTRLVVLWHDAYMSVIRRLSGYVVWLFLAANESGEHEWI